MPCTDSTPLVCVRGRGPHTCTAHEPQDACVWCTLIHVTPPACGTDGQQCKNLSHQPRISTRVAHTATLWQSPYATSTQRVGSAELGHKRQYEPMELQLLSLVPSQDGLHPPSARPLTAPSQLPSKSIPSSDLASLVISAGLSSVQSVRNLRSTPSVCRCSLIGQSSSKERGYFL
jgi:hypothetical protein